MKTMVSIIIPIYNALPYLEECLNSVADQESVSYEVLLINNGSTDDSLSVCRSFAEQFNYFKVFDIHSSSIGEVRNFGLNNANGKYIMFIDADDYLPGKTVLRDLVSKIRSSSADICVGNFSRLWGDSLLHATSHRSFSRFPVNSARFLFTGFFSVDILSYVWAKLYRKSFINDNQLRFSDYKYAEDKLFNLQCCAKGARYSFLNREVYTHRNTPDSVSKSYRIQSHLVWLNIAHSINDIFADESSVPYTWKCVTAYTIFFGCFFDCKMEYLHCGKKTGPVARLLKEYGRDPLSKKCYKLLSHPGSASGIASLLYKFFVCGFAVCMQLHLYHTLSLGIKLLVDLKIDEMLSDTGKKPT